MPVWFHYEVWLDDDLVLGIALAHLALYFILMSMNGNLAICPWNYYDQQVLSIRFLLTNCCCSLRPLRDHV